jgi:hypothetical protein
VLNRSVESKKNNGESKQTNNSKDSDKLKLERETKHVMNLNIIQYDQSEYKEKYL